MTISLFRFDATRAGSGAAWDWIFFLLNLDLIFRYPSNVLQNGRYWKFHCSFRSNRVYCMLIEWLLEVVGKCEGLIRMCTTCWMLTCFNNNMIFENRDGASSYVNLSIIIQFSVLFKHTCTLILHPLLWLFRPACVVCVAKVKTLHIVAVYMQLHFIHSMTSTSCRHLIDRYPVIAFRGPLLALPS